MKKLAKMNAWDCTIPVGKECACGSELEAVTLAHKAGFNVDSMELMLITTLNGEKPFCWCHMKDMEYTCFTVFKQDPALSSPPKSGLRMADGEFIHHGEDVYQILQNKDLGQTIRQVSIFDTALKADVAYRLSPTGQADKTPEEYPDYYLVRLTKFDNPKDTICISWLIEKEPVRFFQPVFLEDFEKYVKTDPSKLNWEFMHEGETFGHDNRIYQVCKDEDDDYYIAPLCPVPMQVIRCNL
ncbi:MAG: hypothetical protein IJ660_02420 [Alphaproteobacteria bacterium]|nr:hypothetical protein [Alphaproteobacteria bacterium]